MGVHGWGGGTNPSISIESSDEDSQSEEACELQSCKRGALLDTQLFFRLCFRLQRAVLHDRPGEARKHTEANALSRDNHVCTSALSSRDQPSMLRCLIAHQPVSTQVETRASGFFLFDFFTAKRAL